MAEELATRDSTKKKRQPIRVQSECKICGGSALYAYFGVIACIPCKMFFKRNAEHGRKSFKCDFEGNCDISVNNRHVCSYCRLMKCFQCGMEIERMRSSVPKIKKTSTDVVKVNVPEQFPTLNLLRADQSTLTVDQWNLISNVSNCYDEYTGLSIGEQFVREQNALPLKLRLKSIAAIINFSVKALDGLRLVYEKNRDFVSLSPDDRSILLQQTFKNAGCLITHFILYKVGATQSPTFYETIESLSNPLAMRAAQRLHKQFDYDIIVHKLLLAILCFSTVRHTKYSDTCGVNICNIKLILSIQDSYVELLWRYLIYRNPFEEAVRCMGKVLQCLFISHEIIIKSEETQWYIDHTDSLVRQIEESLVLGV